MLKLAFGDIRTTDKYIKTLGEDGQWKLFESIKVLEDEVDLTVDEILLLNTLGNVPHRDLVEVLELIYDKLRSGAKLLIKTIDMEWLSKQIIRFESGQILSGKYADFEGNLGLQTLVYGDEQAPIQSCFTRLSLWELLDGVGFEKIKIEQIEEEIGILSAKCIKP
jgi:hypothetical protein